MKLAAAAVTALLIGAGLPAAAQMPLPPPGELPDGPDHRGNPMFAGLSDAGRAIMYAAMKDADPRGAREATGAARDRMLAILDADRLDVGALRRAMDDERESANAAKIRHQTAMIAGFQQLSLADRKAFVVNARAMRSRIEDRMGGWKGRRGPGGPGGPGMMPPPPQ